MERRAEQPSFEPSEDQVTRSHRPSLYMVSTTSSPSPRDSTVQPKESRGPARAICPTPAVRDERDWKDGAVL